MKTKNTFENFPDWVLEKWKDIADILAETIDIPSALIMKTENEFMEVFISNHSENNPYPAGGKEKWHGLYCETVIKTQNKLLVPNATKDKVWDKNPDIKLGMIAYLGFPLNFPDGQPFGTLCVLDNKERSFTSQNEKLILQFKNVIELDLALLQSFELKTSQLNTDITQEISERKQAEEVLRERTSELQRINKELAFHLREIEQFTYIASHDLVEPLNGLTNFTNLLHDEYAGKLDEDGNKSIDFIYSSATRMRLLLKGLLDYSLLGKDSIRSEVDCNKVVAEVLSYLSADIKASDARITVQELPRLIAYETEMRLLLQHLISNAIKFRKKDILPKIEISAESKGDEWVFSIADNGIGIKKKDQENVFIIFRRMVKRDDYEGTGIGLAQCKKIVELHGGRIWVEANQNGWSTFRFTIPI